MVQSIVVHFPLLWSGLNPTWRSNSIINVRGNRPLYTQPCSAGAQWIPRVVDRTDRRATTFTMSLSRQPPVKCTLNSCGTAHLVMLCDCSTALCKEKIGTDKDLLHADPVHNASLLFFSRSTQLSSFKSPVSVPLFHNTAHD